MTEYTGIISSSGTFAGTGSFTGYTATLTQTDHAMAELTINTAAQSFVGTIDQFINTSGAFSQGTSSTPFATTFDTGAQPFNGNVSQSVTLTFFQTGTIVTFGYTANVTETMHLSGDYSTISVSGTEAINLSGSLGTISFTGTLHRADPTLVANTLVLSSNQSVAATAFISVANPNGDNITQYTIQDIGGGSGHLSLAGTAQPDGHTITVDASAFSGVQYVGSTSAGTDTLVVDAYDATIGSWLPSVSLSAVTTAPFLPNQNDVTEAVYIGYFGRAAEPAGDSYWLSQLSSGSISSSGMAASFSVQPESQALYPFLANPSTATLDQIASFIQSVYGDLFNRSADSSGLTYWQNNLTTNLGNPQAVGAFILNVISGAQGTDQTIIGNKVTVAEYFTQKISSAGINFTASANALAHSVIASVTADASTISAAESTIDTWLSTAPSAAEIAVVGLAHTSSSSG